MCCTDHKKNILRTLKKDSRGSRAPQSWFFKKCYAVFYGISNVEIQSVPLFSYHVFFLQWSWIL